MSEWVKIIFAAFAFYFSNVNTLKFLKIHYKIFDQTNLKEKKIKNKNPSLQGF